MNSENSNDFITVHLKPLYIPFSNESFGKYRLLENQYDLLRSTNRILVIDSPTSSGKTLGIIAKLLKREPTSKKLNGILVYPTNELIRDQLNNIKKYLTDMFEYIIDDFGEIPEKPLKHSVGIFEVSGPKLDEILEEYHLRAKGSILRRILISGLEHKIILTNPDTLYLLVRAEYKYGLELLRDLIQENFNFLALDEFHLYSGVTLMNLLTTLTIINNLLDQIIISTATIPEKTLLTRLEKIFNERIYRVKYHLYAHKIENARKIRHRTKLKLVKIPSEKKVLWREEDIDLIRNLVYELYEKYKKYDTSVKVLIIVNSVIFAEKLRRKLEEDFPEKVAGIHGFVPSKLRRLNEITVGTSAIEVGIDFITPSLIFEANDAASFIQRLGRVSRHMDGEAIGIIPYWDWEVIKKKIKTPELDYETFNRIILESMNILPSYSDFIQSLQARLLLYSYIWRLTGYLVKTRKISREARESQFIKLINESARCFLSDSPDDAEKELRYIVLFIKKQISLGKYIKALEKYSFRAPRAWIPGIYNGEIINLSIEDLNYIDFEIHNEGDIKQLHISKETRKYLKRKMELADADFFLEIRDIGTYNNIRFTIIDRELEESSAPFIISDKNLACQAEYPDIANHVMKILRNDIAFISTRINDWRLSGFRLSKNKWLIIGPDSLLAWYISQQKQI